MATPQAHDAAVTRANEALRTYTLSAEGWHRSPGETLQHALTDLLHWCDDTQRDFDAALERARRRHAGDTGQADGTG
ncbi:hypothetical protein HXP44_09670 [Streptomyces sioyaensis]|uniref:Uncharacterized protein n=1 Tax=Streptomyces sioyaensis TaxID=67364 RepID=A0A4Q1R0M8_9ACTN|nr:hypothetical protein [Streptomyces sioyaensis]MBM4792315.1 hypothetical protein [Streptomyces sioyaensis]RXS66031.1 hypothetical protein EST54_16760 [Streptomyces sioyaensis]